MAAALAGNHVVAKLLLSRGVRINNQRPDGYNALRLACEYGRVETFGHDQILGLLLDKRPRVNARRPNKCTALYVANEHGQATAARLLLKHGAGIEMEDDEGVHDAPYGCGLDVHRPSDAVDEVVSQGPVYILQF
ncbi:hypothetical protein PRIC2_009795 [Phytophthora ramorum]